MGLLKPKNSESQSEFLARALEALKDKYPDADKRTAYALNCWYESRGDTDADRAVKQMFNGDEFIVRKNIPIFAEHQTTDSEGNPQQYDRAALMKIIDKCNSRIEDTGDVAALTAGHTPDRDDVAQGAKQPEVLGYVGPFRLGQIGNKKPRYAILADEHVYRDVESKTKRMPRRSVELWMSPEMEERFVDPIAALGAEAPRLDLGMRFARSSASGELVEKYTGPVAAMPSGGNTFIPSEGNEKKSKKYEAKEPRMLAPEEVKQIVDAISQLSWAQWAKDQESAGEMPEADVAPEEAGEDLLTDNSGPNEEIAPVDAAPEDGDVEQYDEELPEEIAEDPIAEDIPEEVPPIDAEIEDDLPEIPAEDEEEEEFGARYDAELDEVPEDEEKEDYIAPALAAAVGGGAGAFMGSKAKNSRKGYKDRYRAEQVKYQKLQRENAEMRDKYGKLSKQVNGLRRSAVDSERESQLERYRLEFAFDLEAEKSRCLYSRGSKMTRETFEDHLNVIRDNYRKIPHARTLPAGKLETTDREKHERSVADAAYKYAESERKAGRHVRWDQALSHVQSQENKS